VLHSQSYSPLGHFLILNHCLNLSQNRYLTPIHSLIQNHYLIPCHFRNQNRYLILSRRIRY
jgi:hypothetical protein